MKTRIMTEQAFAAGGDKEAAALLDGGEVVAFPTETVYGLGANALDEKAVKKIFLAKGRPQDNPLIVHISSLEMLSPLVKEVPQKANELMRRYWPGPLTSVMKRTERIPAAISAGLDTVAVRFPSNPIAKALIEASGVPIAAPSANLSGSPSPTTAYHVMQDMDGRIEMVLDGGECEFGVESTVVSIAGDTAHLLRPGAVTAEMLREIYPDLVISKAVLDKLEEGQKAESPGMKYKHYAPKAHVVIVDASAQDFARFVNTCGEDVYVLAYEEEASGIQKPCITVGYYNNPQTQAHELFKKLRELDEVGATKAYIRAPRQDGMGLAVYNRLLRAAAFEVITLE